MLWKQLLSGAALMGFAAAQVTSDCDPYRGDKCDPNPALGTEYLWNFNATPNGQLWENQVGSVDYSEDDGGKFTIDKRGDSPTLRTKFYFFFGRAEFIMKAASGKGIVSSMMLLSDDLDEIDWEFIGTNSSASTNFYGKGIEEYTNGEWHDMPSPVQDDYHNYTTVWGKEKLEFFIDDNLVRTVDAKDAKSKNGTDIYPQTPMRMSLGIWAGGDPSLNKWTREWAGGDTDYNNGPYDMYVKQVFIADASSGKEYKWKDDSGTMDSIEIVKGNSTAVDTINQKPEKSLNEKFNDLPQAAKASIYAGGAAVAAVMLAAVIFYCIRQRRRGAQEARQALQASETDRMEMNRFHKSGIDPDGFTEHGAEYNAKDMKGGGMMSDTAYNVPNDSTSTLENEKAWGGAAAVGAGAGAAAMRNQTQSPGINAGSYHDNRGPGSPQSFSHGGFASPTSPHVAPLRTPSPAMTRSQSPMMRSPGSPGPQQAYGSHRMQQDPSPFADQGYGANRMQSPGPSPMSPSARSFSSNQGYGYGNGMDRMNSPGPHGYRQ